MNLPNGVVGDFTLAIELPEGASLSSTVPGAVLYDPVNGDWVIDLALLGVDPSDPTMTAESILFTPPEHQSSPDNPFAPGRTFGPDDPYDGLNALNYTSTLNNVSCRRVTTDSGSFAITINPVVDGPEIVIAGASSFDEDTEYALDIQINGIDGGERPVGNVLVTFDADTLDQLLDANGGALTGTDIGGGQIQFALSLSQLPGLRVVPYPNYSGPLTITVTATSQDIDGSRLDATVTRTLNVIPVADLPYFTPDTSIIDPDTGEPFIDVSGDIPVVTAIEDVPLSLDQFLSTGSPDMDGSETVTIVLSGVPDYLRVSGPSGSGFINNGDGSYTISGAAFSSVTLQLKDAHARLPDSLDPSLPSEIRLTLSVNTLELANSDQQTGSRDFILRVRPDADTPEVIVSASPTSGIEDATTPYTLDIAGTTADPHESMVFEVVVPEGGQILVNGVAQPVVGGVVTLDGGTGASTGGGLVVFAPSGTVTFLPPEDFAGDTGLEVTAITTDADGIFTDTARSTPADIDFDITPSPDLVIDVTEPVVELAETDLLVRHRPAGDFDIAVTDTDGSEFVDSVTYSIEGVPEGTRYRVGSGPRVDVTDTLTFTGSLDEFEDLVVIFPADFATNGTPLAGSILVTTNEGGSESGTFSVSVAGELDLSVTIDVEPDPDNEAGARQVIDFGIDAQVTDRQTTASEWLEEVVIQFDSALPARATASAGTISGDRLVLTRGNMSQSSFVAMVAALSISLPARYSGEVSGTVTVSTNHGTAEPEAFSITVNQTAQSAARITPVADTATNAATLGEESEGQPADAGEEPALRTASAEAAYASAPTGETSAMASPTETMDAQMLATSDEAETLQLVAEGTHTGPDGLIRDRMGDATGTPGRTSTAQGTGGDDAVILDTSTPYDGIDRFTLLDGSDFIDLGGSDRGYVIDLGAGNDWAIGSQGDDFLVGGAGHDRLWGGGGADVFRLTDLADADSILDFEGPDGAGGGDRIDLGALVSLGHGETLDDRVGYDPASGQLSVDGAHAATIEAAGGGFAAEVEVIFSNAAGAQETAVV